MIQFDVCPVSSRTSRGRRISDQFVVILQHDALNLTSSVVIAPVHDADEIAFINRLHVRFSLLGKPRIVPVERLAAIDRARLQPAITNLSAHGDAFRNAVDLFFVGF